MKKIIPGTRVQTNWRYQRFVESMFTKMKTDGYSGIVIGICEYDKNVAEVETIAPNGEKFKATFHKDWLEPVERRRKICKMPNKPKRK